MTKIAVTGGSGKAGRVVVRDLHERGHQVLNIDLVPSLEGRSRRLRDARREAGAGVVFSGSGLAPSTAPGLGGG